MLPLTLTDAPAVIASGLSKAGFILDPDAALMAIAACSGAPACDRASRPSQEDARNFAVSLPPPPYEKPLLHVSGCAKGCAHPRAAPITLVAREGRYDVVLRYTATAPPDHLGLTVADAQTFLTKFFKTKGI
ncbi:hypothetical protein [Elstera litoralis]|uniref:hypothetical protein n=1 Tax=Elstera litoralis TaxID=552518 RepID=UPI0006987146|nr:hypothetical protein [Elstera litoralis]